MGRPLAACASIVALLAAIALAEDPRGEKPSLTAVVEQAVNQTANSPLPAGALLRLGMGRFVVTGQVFAAAFSPDGKMLAVAASPDRERPIAIRVFEAKSGRELRRLETSYPGGYPEPDSLVLAFTDDGRQLWWNDVFWDVESWRGERRAAAGGALAVAAGAPWGLFPGEERYEVKLVDLRTRSHERTIYVKTDRKIDSIPAASLPYLDAQRAAFSADGKMLAIAGGGRAVCVYSIPSGTVLRTFLLFKDPQLLGQIHSLAFSPDGRKLAVAGSGLGGVRLFDIESGKELRRSAGKHSEDEDAAAAKNRRSRNLQYNRSAYASQSVVRFSPDNKSLLVAWSIGSEIEVRDAATGTATATIAIEDLRAMDSLAFSPDGQVLVVGGQSDWGSGLRLVDWKTREETFPPCPPSGVVTRLTFSPDSSQLASGSSGVLASGSMGGEIQLWDARSGRLSLKLESNCASSLAYSPDGWALGAAGEGAYHLWATDSAADIVQRPDRIHIQWPPGTMCCSPPSEVQFAWGSLSPELSEIIASGGDGKIHIVSTAKGEEVRSFQTGPVAATAWSPDGRIIATSNTEAVTDMPAGLAVVNGAVVAAVGGPPTSALESIQVWDVATGKQIKQLESKVLAPVPSAYQGSRLVGFTQIVFAPDGQTLAARNGSGEVVVFDLTSGRQFFQFKCEGEAFCFAADGQTLFHFEHGAVQGIELASGRVCWKRLLPAAEVTPAPPDELDAAEAARQFNSTYYSRSPRAISAIAAAPDGRSLATAMASDNTIVVWSLLPDGAAALPAAKPLSDEELARLWKSLTDVDAEAATDAIWKLAAAGNRAVDFFRLHISIASRDPKATERISAAIANLDNDVPEVRHNASDELAAIGGDAEPLLRQALANKPSLEARVRIEHLLAKIEDPVQRFGGETLRRIRAILILERIGTRPAADLLATIAAGPPEARETKDAKATLERRRLLAKGR